ncbi:MAG: hypothetical protein KJN90_12250 [Gammaproteobacteria bacterium]|nr:hypothetical protein [Gammaproteobacteria bacterium]
MNSFSKKTNNAEVCAWETPRLFDQENPAKLSSTEVEARQGVYEEAFKEGYENGKALGMQEAKDQVQLIQNIVDGLARPFDDQSQQLAESIAKLAGKIARAVVSSELNTEPELILNMVRETIAALNSNEQEVHIHLNPRNAQLIRELLQEHSNGQTWHIVDDPHVSLEDCKVRCQDAVVDTDLDTRINLIISQLLEDESNENKA